MARLVHCGVMLASALAVKIALGQEQVTAPELAPADAANAADATDDSGGIDTSDAPEVEIDMPGGEVLVLGRRDGDIEKNTTQVVSLLSAEDIARTGEGDIAGALSHVTGLSVVGGGFVYVRGLGDRYSLALLNGSPLPSPEPLKRAVPLDLFPTDVVASSLVQKTYSANFPGEFGGGVINLTTLSIPKAGFLNLNVGGSGDTETTGNLGYTYFGSGTDWTGYGNRDVPAGLASFFASGERISGGSVDTGEIARGFMSTDELIQRVDEIPANYSLSMTGGQAWMLGDSQLGLIGTAGYSNEWRTRDNTEQTPGAPDLSSANKDYRSVITDNHIVANALVGLAYEFGDGNRLRWTNVYVHDTLKQGSLSEGQWNVTYTGYNFLEQHTAWYERELLSTQLSAGFNLDPVNIDARASFSRSSREAPYELDVGYAQSNAAGDPYGAYFLNRLSGQNRNYANMAFSDLTEDMISGGLDATWRVNQALALSAGVDVLDTRRDSERREFQIRAPSTFPAGVAMLRPDYLLGAAVIDYYDIGLIETTETDPKFEAQLRTYAGYAQAQAYFGDDLELSLGVRYERGEQDVAPVQVFTTPSNSGASTSLENDYILPAATLTYRFSENMQARINASATIARPQFRELMFQKFHDPEANRDYLGNPLLTDSQFVNAEARYEWYMATDQQFSLAAFWKQIDDPIETYTSYPEGDAPVTSFANAPEAQLYGAEVELQKQFALGGESGSGFFGTRRLVSIANYTYTNSKIRVGSGDTVQIYGSTSTTRPATDYFTDGSQLTGQSDHLVNLQLGLESLGRMSQQTVLLSYASDRVTSRAGGSYPDIYESPGLRVDFVARQGFTMWGQELEGKFEVRNIFQQGYQEFQEMEGNTIYFNKYDVGTSFSLSFTALF